MPRFSVAADVAVHELSRNQSSPSPAPFSKALLLIVDALRLDFLRAQEYSVASQYVESMEGVRNAAAILVWPRVSSSGMIACVFRPAVMFSSSCR